MIKCNIEINEYTTNVRTGEDEFSYSYTKFVINFPVLPEVGDSISITDSTEHFYEVLEIEFRAVVRERHDYHDNIASAEVYLICKEI